ncbi:MAG: Ni,Fe-hydrogenase III large subunit [Cellvibrionaceae bacterium]
MRGFTHDNGEGSLSPCHLEIGGEIIVEIDTGYFYVERTIVILILKKLRTTNNIARN